MGINFLNIYSKIVKINIDKDKISLLNNVFKGEYDSGFIGETHSLVNGKFISNKDLGFTKVRKNSYFVKFPYLRNLDLFRYGAICLLDDNLNKEDLNKIKNILKYYHDLIPSSYTLINSAMAGKIDTAGNHNIRPIKNLNDLEKFTPNLNSFPKNVLLDIGKYYYSISTIFTSFGYRPKEKLISSVNNYYDNSYIINWPANIFIIKEVDTVIDIDNNSTRVAFLVNSLNSKVTKIIISSPGEELYDFLDKGRILITNKTVRAIFDISLTPEYLNNNCISIDKINDYYNKNKQLVTVIPEDIPKFRNIAKVRDMKKTSIKDKMIEKIQGLKDKKLVISGLKLEDDKINYDVMTINFNCEVTKKCYQVGLRNLIYRINSNTSDTGAILNFNSLFHEFQIELKEVFNKWKTSKKDEKVSISANNVNIVITKVMKNISSRYYINSIRVNHAEIIPCFSRVLCYTNQVDYNQFLSIVSKCSLETHRFMDSGVNSYIKIDSETFYKMKFSFKRIKNKNYIKIGKEYVPVRNIKNFVGAIKNISTKRSYSNYKNKSSFEEFCELFDGEKKKYFDKDAITDDMLIKVIKEGIKRKEDAIKQSEKLLKDTLKIVGATEEKNLVIAGKKIDISYVLKSKAGNTYAVFEHIGDYSNAAGCQVYKKSMDKDSYTHVCIVDRSLGDQVGKDKLVNRLFALKNDTVIASKISTLASYV